MVLMSSFIIFKCFFFWNNDISVLIRLCTCFIAETKNVYMLLHETDLKYLWLFCVLVSHSYQHNSELGKHQLVSNFLPSQQDGAPAGFRPSGSGVLGESRNHWGALRQTDTGLESMVSTFRVLWDYDI